MPIRPLKDRRVVVTGVGVVSPLGNTAKDTWEAAVAGRSGVSAITRFDPSDLPVRIGGEVKGFDPAQWIDKKEIKKMDTFIHYAVAAAQMAADDAGLEIGDENRERIGVYVGSGIGGIGGIE